MLMVVENAFSELLPNLSLFLHNHFFERCFQQSIFRWHVDIGRWFVLWRVLTSIAMVFFYVKRFLFSTFLFAKSIANIFRYESRK